MTPALLGARCYHVISDDIMARVPILTRLPDDLVDRLATRCDELGMVRNTAIQRALEAWLADDPVPADTAGPVEPQHSPAPAPPAKAMRTEAASTPRMPKALPAPAPAPVAAPRQRMTIDDVRPAFTPRLKQK